MSWLKAEYIFIKYSNISTSLVDSGRKRIFVVHLYTVYRTLDLSWWGQHVNCLLSVMYDGADDTKNWCILMWHFRKNDLFIYSQKKTKALKFHNAFLTFLHLYTNPWHYTCGLCAAMIVLQIFIWHYFKISNVQESATAKENISALTNICRSENGKTMKTEMSL